MLSLTTCCSCTGGAVVIVHRYFWPPGASFRWWVHILDIERQFRFLCNLVFALLNFYYYDIIFLVSQGFIWCFYFCRLVAGIIWSGSALLIVSKFIVFSSSRVTSTTAEALHHEICVLWKACSFHCGESDGCVGWQDNGDWHEGKGAILFRAIKSVFLLVCFHSSVAVNYVNVG